MSEKKTAMVYDGDQSAFGTTYIYNPYIYI